MSRQMWKGRKVVDLRLWFRPQGAVEFVPSRKGLTIDAGKLPELIEALQEV
ncbi:MAG: hypothetical protein J0653_08140 [Deltaproteobacteria bacterium]|nr:hypothetical protein [Deltaproteobacteria bacterium]